MFRRTVLAPLKKSMDSARAVLELQQSSPDKRSGKFGMKAFGQFWNEGARAVQESRRACSSGKEACMQFSKGGVLAVL